MILNDVGERQRRTFSWLRMILKSYIFSRLFLHTTYSPHVIRSLYLKIDCYQFCSSLDGSCLALSAFFSLDDSHHYHYYSAYAAPPGLTPGDRAVSPCICVGSLVVLTWIRFYPPGAAALGMATVAEKPSPMPATPPIGAALAAPSAAGIDSTFICFSSVLAVFMNERNPPAFGAAFLAVSESTIVPTFLTRFACASSDMAACLLSSSGASEAAAAYC